MDQNPFSTKRWLLHIAVHLLAVASITPWVMVLHPNGWEILACMLGIFTFIGQDVFLCVRAGEQLLSFGGRVHPENFDSEAGAVFYVLGLGLIGLFGWPLLAPFVMIESRATKRFKHAVREAQLLSLEGKRAIDAPLTEKCEDCNKHIPLGSRFCPRCGHELHVIKPTAIAVCSCGALCDTADDWCAECGKRLHGDGEVVVNGKKITPRESNQGWRY